MINVIILTAALSTISADVNQQMASEMTITDGATTADKCQHGDTH